MQGISRASGAGPIIDLGGHKLQVRGRVLRYYAEIEAEIINRRGNPFELIRDNKEILKDEPGMMNLFVTRAFDEARQWRFVSGEDFTNFMGTWPGVCMAVWLAVRDNNPEVFTLSHVTELFADDYEEQLKKSGVGAADNWKESIINAVNQASGDDELGNSTAGQDSATSQAEAEASPGAAHQTGD